MSVQEEILRIRHEQEGEKALIDAEQRYEDLRQTVHSLDDQLKTGEISQKSYAEALGRVGRALADAGKEVQVFRRLAADDAGMQAQARAAADAEARTRALGASLADYAATVTPLPAKTHNAAEALAEYAGVATRAAAATTQAAASMNFSIDTGRLDLADRYMRSTAASADKLGGTMGRSGNFGRGAIQAAYLIDDIAAAGGDMNKTFLYTQNQIPILLSSLGMAAKSAGLLSIAFIGVSQAVQHSDEMMGLFQNQWQIPRAAIGSAQDFKDSLKGVNDELEKLTKKGFLTDNERGRYDTLMGRRKEFEEAEAARQSAEEFRKSKPKAEREAGSAFTEAGAEAGAKDVDKAIREVYRKRFANLDPAVIVAEAQKEAEQTDSAILDIEGVRRRLAQRYESMADRAIKGLKEGNQAAFDQAVKLLEAEFGKGSEIATRLRNASPREQARDRALIDQNREKNRLFKENVLDVREADKAREREVRDRDEARVNQIASEATDKHGDIFDESIRRRILMMRDAGAKGPDEIAALRDQIGKNLNRIAPELKAFPVRMRYLREDLVKAARESVDRTIDELRATEGLTRRQAIRRLANRERESQQAAAGQLAGDEFTDLAGRMDAENRRRNPFARRLSARERREQGEAMRRQFEGMGLSEEEQARAARLLGSHPMAGAMLQDKMQQFAGVAPDQRTAFLMALENLEGGGGNAMTARQANAMQRRQGRAFNAAVRQQGRDINEAERIARRGGLPRAAPYTHPIRNRAADAGPADPAKATEDNSKVTADNTDAVKKLTDTIARGVPVMLS